MEFWRVFAALPRIPYDLYRPVVVIRAFSYDPPLILTYTIHCTSCSKAIGGMLGNFMPLLSFADFFRDNYFKKYLSGIRSECRIVWIQIMPDVLAWSGFRPFAKFISERALAGKTVDVVGK